MIPQRRPTRPDRAPLAQDVFRRRLRSIAAIVEVGCRFRPGDAPHRLLRQLLLSAMGSTEAGSGAVLELSGRDRALLVEAFGAWKDPVQQREVVLEAPARADLREGAAVRLLSATDAAAWRRRIAMILPALDPRALVVLDGREGPTGLLLLGERVSAYPYGPDEQGLLTTLAGLFTILSHSLDASNGETAARPARGAPVALMPMRDSIDPQEIHAPLRRFVGRSSVISTILSDLVGVATTHYPVLLEGESGTGKELLASIIHEVATAAGAPFEAVNCGAIPEPLLESELFGHVEGAFTGAVRGHHGVFERARGGTVFLDEVGELPPQSQVKLLRVLQEGVFTPVGGEKPVDCASRLIAASNRDLLQEVEAGRFREDLFYRLNVFPIRIPPLRERREDIPLLIEAILDQHAAEASRQRPKVSVAALRRICVYSFPGNVRELQNLVRGLLIQARGADEIEDHHVIAVFSRFRVAQPPVLDEDGEGDGRGNDGEPRTADGEGRGNDGERQTADGKHRGTDSEDRANHGDDRVAGARHEGPRRRDEVGPWVLQELRRHHFNIALAERALAERKRFTARRRGVPVVSRSGLTYYLQGECLRALAEARWDVGTAARALAGGTGATRRVEGKIDRLLGDALATLRHGGRSPQRRSASLRARFSKIPACYARHLERLAQEFESGRWT
jgi:transcriptional regulator with GAF, ATPase, and Fis domain